MPVSLCARNKQAKRRLPLHAALIALAALAGTAGPAAAQSGSSSNPLVNVEESLASSGIHITGYYEGNYYANVAGGLKRTNVYFSDLAFGANFDLAKLARIPGAEIDLSFDSRFGGFPQGVNDLTGSSVGFLGGAGPDNRVRLTEFTFRQSLDDGTLSYAVGRTTLANFFATSELYCQFETSLCSNLVPFNWSLDSNEPFYPIAVWAGEAQVKPTRRTYLSVGASESNPSQYAGGGFPWNGGWSTRGATGVFVPVEAGYNTEKSDALYPGRYDLGFYYDSSGFSDARYNARGGSLAAVGGVPGVDGPHKVIYAQAERVMWRSSDAKDARRLWGFAGVQFGISGRAPVQAYYQLGLVMQGTFKDRPKDSAGFLATYYVFNPRVTGATNDAIAAAGRTGHMSNSESIFEANYGICPEIRADDQALHRSDGRPRSGAL